MNTERWIYNTCFERLVSRPDVSEACFLLREWSVNCKGRNMARAACEYLAHFVIPTLEGESVKRTLPTWVDTALFHPRLDGVFSVEEWLSLFPGTVCEAIYELESDENRRKVPVIQVDTEVSAQVILDAKTCSRGIFFTPNTHRGNRSAQNVVEFHANFADFDGGTKEEQMERILSLPLEPSILVESGRGYHAYWMYDRPYGREIAEKWEGIQRRIIEVCGSDPAIKDAGRLMRLPFSWHSKHKEQSLVTIAKYTQLTYSIEEIEREFPPIYEQKRSVFYLAGTSRTRDVREPNTGAIVKGERHATLLEEAGRVYAGIGVDKYPHARATLAEWYKKSCVELKKDWEREVEEVCEWVEEKEKTKTSR